MALTNETLETNGTRPFMQRQRRPLIGPAFNAPQLEHLARLEARIAALEAGRHPQVQVGATAHVTKEQVEAIQAHAARQPAPALNPADAALEETKQPSTEGFPGGNAAGYDAIATAVKKRDAEGALLATATPAMVALINEAATPELRDTLIAIAGEDKPAQNRLAAMRKAAQPPTP